MAAVRTSSRIPSTPRRALQRGMGVVGFIVGIVVGLAVALAVAVYVTKVPTPFTDKGPASGAGKAEEQQQLKGWDPNAGLQGKRSAPPASQAPAEDKAPAGRTQPDTAAARKPDATPSKPEAPAEVLGDRDQELAKAREEAAAKAQADLKTQEAERAKAKAEREAKAKAEREARAKQTDRANASSDPIGSLVESRTQPAAKAAPAPATPKAQAADDGFVYFVQAGAFRNHTDADAQRARLGLLGLNARVTERDQAGRTVYRVRLGPFNNMHDANAARSRVESNGMEAALVRVQR